MFGAITDFRAMTGKLQNKLEITCDRKVRKSSNNDRKMSKKKKKQNTRRDYCWTSGRMGVSKKVRIIMKYTN